MDIQTILDYLKSKIPEFVSETKKNSWLFTCPNYKAHSYQTDNPTATFINGTNKINCLMCDFTGDIYSIVKLLEPDKLNYTETQITNYLMKKCDLDLYKELDSYEKYKWYLFPLAKNSKEPVEGQSWKKTSTDDKLKWIDWLEKGNNIGIDCENSKILAIDIDVKNLDKLTEEQLQQRNKIIALLEYTKTLMQNSPSGGRHYIFNIIDGFKNWVNLGGLQIDVRTVGGQLVTQPTKILGKEYRWINLGSKIKDLPEEIKTLLLELPKNKLEIPKHADIKVPEVTTVEAGEGRNNILTSIGGIIVNKFPDNPEMVEWFLHLLNQKYNNPPLPTHEVKTIAYSLKGYKQIEKLSQKDAILDYMKQMQIPITARDIKENLQGMKLTRALIDKYFAQLTKEGLILHWSRGSYKAKETLEWTDKLPAHNKIYEYKIPLFSHLMDFEHGDILLLGGLPGGGKTHIAINIIKQMIEQGVKPYYVCLETGSRYGKISEKLGLIDKDGNLKFYVREHNNPLNISIVENSFTVIDWLNINEFEKTAQVHEYFKNEMQIKHGILIILTQLKKSGDGAYDFFAPNLAEQFPSFTAKYAFDTPDRTEGHWQVSKLRDPKGNFWNARVECVYNPETKLFVTKEI